MPSTIETTIQIPSRFCWLLSYAAGLRAQDAVVARIRGHLDQGSDVGEILGLEHPLVITLGKRGRIEEDLKIDADELAKIGGEFRVCDRGGQATLHSPGQLVIYPCVNLRRLGLGVRTYVELLEHVTIRFLAELGIDSFRGADEPGIYTRRGKIAFFGVHVSRGIASHGLAINVRNDLALFSMIRSCGKSSETFDRVCDHVPETHALSARVDELFSRWIRIFEREWRAIQRGPRELSNY